MLTSSLPAKTSVRNSFKLVFTIALLVLAHQVVIAVGLLVYILTLYLSGFLPHELIWTQCCWLLPSFNVVLCIIWCKGATVTQATTLWHLLPWITTLACANRWCSSWLGRESSLCSSGEWEAETEEDSSQSGDKCLQFTWWSKMERQRHFNMSHPCNANCDLPYTFMQLH